MAQHNLPPRASLLSPRVDVFSHDGTNANPPTLVLDLDETLTHTEVTPIDDADLVFHLQSCGDDAPQPMFVRKRPHVDHFLRTVAQKFEVVIFTASERPYCESYCASWIRTTNSSTTCSAARTAHLSRVNTSRT
mmetsp:Transcript_96274/g.274256  ORF Transcript_96274/g.274256 Transcript_96274/m.274256 type:complete len:134 (-) Transcript_96274:1078-1479(-)